MEYWNSSMKNERKKSDCAELTAIERLEEYLELERKKNQYLMKKYESVLDANEQFASSCENLKMEMNGLLLERTSLFQKNVSLICEKNQLKKELMAQKEILNATSSRNKVILLNMKSAYDELLRNTSILDEFITSHSRDKGDEQYECYDEDDPRFEFNSPRWARANQHTQVLSPIPEEGELLGEAWSAKSKRRLRNPLGRIDNVIDNLTMKRTPCNDASRFPNSVLETQQAKIIASIQDEVIMTDMCNLTKISATNECFLSGKYPPDNREKIEAENKETNSFLKILNKASSLDQERNEKTFTVKSVASNLECRSINEMVKPFNACPSKPDQVGTLAQQETNFSLFDKPQKDNIKQNRCFFPPLYNKTECEVRSDNIPPPTPKSVFKIKQMELSKKWNMSPVTLPMRPIDGKMSEDGEDSNELVRGSKISLTDKSLREMSSMSNSLINVSNKKVPSKVKKRLNSGKNREPVKEGRGKKRKSVFDVLDENFDTNKNENNLKQDLENIEPNKYEMDTILKDKATFDLGSDECFYVPEPKSRNCQTIEPDVINFNAMEIKNINNFVAKNKSVVYTTDDKNGKLFLYENTAPERRGRTLQKNIVNDLKKKVACTKSKNLEDDTATALNGIQTRSRSKKNVKGLEKENDEDVNVENKAIKKQPSKSKNSKTTKTGNATTRATRSKRKNVLKEIIQQPLLPNEENVYKIESIPISNSMSSQKENLDFNKYLPISTPKSISNLSQRVHLSEISISPISKATQDCEQKVLNKQQINPIDINRNNVFFEDKNKNNYQHDKEIQSEKKYTVLADLLRSTANHKVATKDDIAQIKRFLINLGCGDKNKESKSEGQKVSEEIKEEISKENLDITNISVREDITSLLTTLSPSLVSVIKSLDIEDSI